MRAEGHIHASKYPLAFMWNELAFVKERSDAKWKKSAILSQAASIGSKSKEGAKYFKEVIEEL